MKRFSGPLAATLLALLICHLGVLPALAHANLVRSDPAPNSVLPAAPPAVQLWFSEEPEPRFSEITVFTPAGVRIQTGAIQVAPEDKKALFVKLNGLQPGSYTVAWKAVSALDGHTTAGAFAFAVGVGQTVTAPTRAALQGAGTTTQATVPGTALRWFTYLSMAMLVGALGFRPLVLDPTLWALRQTPSGDAQPESARRAARVKSAERRAERAASTLLDTDAAGVLWPDVVRLASTRMVLQLAYFGLWATLITTVLAAVAQAASAANVSLLQALSFGAGAPLAALILGTRYGQVWIGRVLILGLTALAMSRLRATRRPPTQRTQLLWWIALAIALLVPLTTSLSSHAAALQPSDGPGSPVAPVIADWLHLAAMSVWIGGLVELALALPVGVRAAGERWRTALVATLIPHFTSVAFTCVAALIATGLYQSILEVGSFGALFGTTYGKALVVKLALFGPLILLGAYNMLFARPRLARAARAAAGGAGLIRAFRLAVGAELLLASVVLAGAGVMTLSQPAKSAWADLTRGVTIEKTADDLRLTLRVDPGVPGFNTVALRVRDSRGRPVANAEKVVLIVSMVEHDMGINEIVLEPQGDGWYQADTGITSMIGTWTFEALVRRQGRDDARTTFRVPLDYAAAPTIAVPAANATPIAPAEARFLKNPVSKTPESLAAGQTIYQQNCLVCHGVQGRGDGPAARTLRPPPADLAQHVSQHTDGELWWWVTNGIPGTAMPAWREALSDVDRWNVVNYLESALGAR